MSFVTLKTARLTSSLSVFFIIPDCPLQLAVEKDVAMRKLTANQQNCEHLQQDLQENVERRMEMEQDNRATEEKVRPVTSSRKAYSGNVF